jgi:glycosyltransferase involved in cell wall biosynthesis
MRISVIIPVKNRADLIGITLRSILAQTLLPHEIIVVDDASTDDLDHVLQSFGPAVTKVASEGKGPGAARNTGLRMATGDAIQFFDSDDLMSTNKFEVQAALLKNEQADFVYGPYCKAEWVNGTWERKDAIMQYHPLPSIPLADAVLQGWCLTQTVLFNAGFLRKAGPWKEGMRSHEDWEFGYRMAKQAKKFVHEDETFVIYRQHSAQATQHGTALEEKINNHLLAYDAIRGQLHAHPSFHSKWMFNGIAGVAKNYYKKSTGKNLSLTPAEYWGSWYRRIYTKIDLKRNHSGWLSIYGAKDDEQLFQQYLRLFNLAS